LSGVIFEEKSLAFLPDKKPCGSQAILVIIDGNKLINYAMNFLTHFSKPFKL